MNKRNLWLAGGAFAASVAVGPSVASDNTKYTYDALGRLVKVEVTGGPATGVRVNTQFDPAGNRSSYAVSGGPASVAFAVNSVNATEGSPLVFTVTKTGTAAGTLTINYATSNGTAGSGDKGAVMWNMSLLAVPIMATSVFLLTAQQKILSQDNMIIIFDNAKVSDDMDTRYCFNAAASQSVRKRLETIIKKKYNPKIKAHKIRNFFDRGEWSPSVVGHYHYYDHPIPEFCERKDLIVIDSVR